LNGIEELEKKYLIALQSLKDCMNEFGISNHQMDYFRQIRAEGHVPQIGYFLRELKGFSMEEEPQDIFITNYLKGEISYSEVLLNRGRVPINLNQTITSAPTKPIANAPRYE